MAIIIMATYRPFEIDDLNFNFDQWISTLSSSSSSFFFIPIWILIASTNSVYKELKQTILSLWRLEFETSLVLELLHQIQLGP